MQRIAPIAHLGMTGPRIDSPQNPQMGRVNPLEQLLTGAQTEVFSDVGNDQPAFAPRRQMGRQTGQEAA